MDYTETKKTSQLYMKLFWIYTSIAIVIVSVLAGYFLTETRRSVVEWKEETADRICKETAQYIEDKALAADDMYMEIYRDKGILDDLLNYFEMEPEEYQKYRLDRYSASAAVQYGGVQEFIEDSFETYGALKKIELLSYEKKKLTTYHSQDIIFPYKDGTERLLEITEGYEQKEELQFVKEIRNPDNMKVTGCMVITFNCKGCFRGIENHRDYADVLLVKDYRNIICGDGNEELFREIMEEEERQDEISIAKHRVFWESAADYQVYVIVNNAKAAQIEGYKILAILGVSAAALAMGIFLINLYLRRLNSRVENIVQGMERVTTGDLQVRLYTNENRDELDIIAGRFNKMCEDLQNYIEKSYLAEIEAKNAELEALQSQINPHFLYNTLEAIRMRAICNGDREVGKMLYSMSVLFRSQLKEADWITIGQELDYCKQYLGLFEVRYQGNFKYEIECPVELMASKVIKFILQPILENYFVHGIRRQENDNVIGIHAEEKDGDVYFCVEDNGIGMEPDEITEKNRELRENREGRQDKKKAVGISNVNRRIKAVYGEDYGIRLKAGKNGGLEVIVHIKKDDRL